MDRIIFATCNSGKIKEIRQTFKSLGKVEILSMTDAGVNIDIEENGQTFEENALIKARAIAKLLPNDIVMSDDSGLEIDYLGGKPGVYSARFLGHDTSAHIKNMHFLNELKGVPDNRRTARFVCAIATVLPDDKEIITRGTCEGMIGHEEKGSNGFGYDPIFYLPNLKCYLAELTTEQKQSISHRGNALRAMLDKLKQCEL
jgi:XTP/dITP diphosphohydrolase